MKVTNNDEIDTLKISKEVIRRGIYRREVYTIAIQRTKIQTIIYKTQKLRLRNTNPTKNRDEHKMFLFHL